MRMCVAILLAACGSSGSQSADAPRGIDAGGAPGDGAVATCPSVTTFDPAGPELAIAGETAAAGIFDPSILAGDTLNAAVAYSSVPDQMTIRTHLAVTSDGGAHWTLAAEPNVPVAAQIASTDSTECPTGTCSGNLISEVSSLIYDADDPDANRRWKLFAHRYLVGANVALHYRLGTIALQTAPAPNGPWTAPAEWIGWNSSASYTSTGVHTNASTLSGTADCLALTEPAALWRPGTIDLAVGCVYLDAGAAKIRIELLRSTDHAATFTSVATLLRPDDAACSTPGASINGADLFVDHGTEYVAATPSDGSGYHGCLVFTIDDATTGHVARDASGRAFVKRTIAPTSGQFSGACTFATGFGYQLDLGAFGSATPFHVAVPGITAP